MVVGLKPLLGAAPGRARRAALAAVVLLVIAVHAWITQHVVDRIADLNADSAMPERLTVAYVRDMPLAAPPQAAPAAPPAAVAPRAVRSRPPKPAAPASAPEVTNEPVLALAAPDPAPPLALPEVPASEPAASPAAPVADAASAVPAVAAAAAAASTPAGFEWPSSTRVSYLLTGNVRGEVNGSAQVEWIRSGSRYQVHLDLVVGPSIAPIITRRMSSDGEITAEGLAPRRYDQDTKVVLRERNRLTVTFDPDTIVLANGDQRGTVPGVQDTASQFVQLMYVFSTKPELLRIGNSVDIPLALPHKVAVWTYDVVADDVLAAPFGPLPTIHLKPRGGNVRRAGELSAEIWFAPQLRYFPVRIRIHQDAETFIDLMISKRPEMGN